jgi:hypothetical protein
VIDTCIAKIRDFESVENAYVKDEANDLVIVEFAETLARLAQVVDQDSFDENMVYELMNCRFPAVQKSCFVLLKHFNSNFVQESPLIKVGFSIEDKEYEVKIS